jgi:RNA polymerase sigma factor (sigma-70 family)
VTESTASDRALEDAAGGDVQAFERFHRATVARIHTLARRLLGAERAEEAVQEVYLRAWNARASWRGEGPASAWLRRIALNHLLNERARAELRTQVGADPGALADPGERADRLERRLDLEQAIADLPRGARTVLVLHDVEGLAHAEIAERLAVSVGTSKSQLHRARALLRASLGEDFSR